MDFDTFLQACQDGDLTLVNQGLPQMDVQQTDAQGNPALMCAALCGHIDVVNVLLRGSDLMHANNDGDTALMWAARYGHLDIVQVLAPSSDLRHADRYGNTALIWATSDGHLDVVKVLLPGSDLRHANKQGMNAWALAQQERCWPIVDLLSMHHPQRETLKWPTEAKPEDLPQWFARIEQRALNDIPPTFPVESNDQSKVRSRL